jgi:hypothetical protein
MKTARCTSTFGVRIPFAMSLAVVVMVILISSPQSGRALQCSDGDCPPSDGTICFRFCSCPSPIVIDLSGKGFQLTSAQDGVWFDIMGTGKPTQIAWTAPGVDNAFLVLDRDGNGKIDSGKELFGNYTAQPHSAERNGFLALALFDQSENGGNGDRVIDAKDLVYSSLRLWVDANHDGISQPEELFKLPDRGVLSISLNYKEAGRTDQYGNQFRFRGQINVEERALGNLVAGRIAYDVFLATVGRKQTTLLTKSL